MSAPHEGVVVTKMMPQNQAGSEPRKCGRFLCTLKPWMKGGRERKGISKTMPQNHAEKKMSHEGAAVAYVTCMPWTKEQRGKS